MSSDRWLSIAQAASCLGVLARTMRRYTDDGRFAEVRCPGGRLTFRLAELERARHDRAAGGGGRGPGVVVYAWVSSGHQQAGGDLDGQVRRVTATAGIG